ncbi:MAG TPA: asparagine synthase (glutamine-hydrolyzing), partial [Thermoanaerobaculia bacterium]
MCGIAGILDADHADPGAAIAMANRIRHRGPDGSGEWSCAAISLSHRRLSIIDLEGGRQPLANEDASVHVTYNGEIYNFRELRKTLLDCGHTFTTVSDTEVLVHAWEEWGRDCVEKLRGMFAFAIWDEKKQQLLLARDRAGIKPLYYYRSGSRFAFASELQAFSGWERTLDPEALDLYLHFQYIPAPYTIYKEIRKLPPAHTLLISPRSEPDIRRYWSLRFEPGNGLSESQWLDELDAVISESVRLHLVSDVPFGAFLSGGVDSSLVTSYMSEHLRDEHVRTYSIGFDDPDYDELPYARIVSDYLHTTHREEMVYPDAIAILPELVRHYGEPFADSSAIPTYYVSRLAAADVKMVLSGDGGDEAFAGYASYAFMAREHRPARGFARRARFLLGSAGRRAHLLPPLADPRRTWFSMVAGF